MTKVLMIANEFPPMGGSGIQRSLKFAKYLPDQGFDPLVVSKNYKGPVRDESFLKELPPKMPIHYLKPFDLMHHKGFLAKVMRVVARVLVVPDPEFFWQLGNRKRVLRLLDEEEITCLYTTSFPYSSHLLGKYLKDKRPHIRWVADFRDEWTNNPYYEDMPWMRYRLPLEKKMEASVCKACDYFITNTPFMLKNSLKDYPFLRGKSTFIPNGFDPQDFEAFDPKPHVHDQFVITYTGSLYGRRNLEEFFKALAEAIKEGSIALKDVAVHLVGNITAEVLEGFKDTYDLGDHVVSHGYMSHHQSIEKLFASDVLLLSMGSGKGLENFYSGKIFEYIRVNRPILAAVPIHGAAASVIKETHTGIAVDSDDHEGIKQALITYYEAWKNGGIDHQPDWDVINTYSRVQQTQQLADLLRG